MKRNCLIILLFSLAAVAYGQNQDLRLWTSLSMRYEGIKKLKITLEEEARFFENISSLDKLNTEFTVSYKISKVFDAGLLYRLISNHKPGGSFSFDQRFGLFLEAQKKYAGWSFSCKGSFQKTFMEVMHAEHWETAENYLRPLAEISKELKNKNTEPYVNIEFWYRLKPGDQAFIDQYRFTAGIKHKLNKSNRLDFFYRLQQEVQVNNPLTAHIIGIGYRYTIR